MHSKVNFKAKHVGIVSLRGGFMRTHPQQQVSLTVPYGTATPKAQ